MKAIGVILVFASGIVLAVMTAGEYIKRIKNLRGLISDFEILKNEVLFRQSTLYEGLEILSGSGKKKEFHKKAVPEMKKGIPPKEAFKNACDLFRDSFTKEDIDVVSEFAGFFGETDMDGERRAFDSLINRLNISLSEAEKNKNEKLKPKCAVILSGFFIIGIFLI